jgi:hypothetical protein
MKRMAYLLCAVVGTVGCQSFLGETLTEELPNQATQAPQGFPQGTPIAVQPVKMPSPAPVTSPVPVPQPQQPSPQPTAVPTPQPVTTPAPSGGGSQDPGRIHHVRVAFFGVDCRNGKQEPNNGARQVPVGCVGHVTATPKMADNRDVPASEHGPNISWEWEGRGAADLRPSIFPSDWNKDVHGTRPGSWMLCATVKGVTGCLEGTTTP